MNDNERLVMLLDEITAHRWGMINVLSGMYLQRYLQEDRPYSHPDTQYIRRLYLSILHTISAAYQQYHPMTTEEITLKSYAK